MDKLQLQEGIDKMQTRLRKPNRVFTIGDASALTGLPLDKSKEILDSLMEKYDCRLQVTENGDLIYDFGPSLHPRGQRTWAEWWQETKKWLWKVFVVVFKVWISIMLVVYFVIFLVLLIAMVVAMMAGNKDGDNDSGSVDLSGFFHVIGDLFRSIFWWQTITGNTYYDRDSRGYRYRRYESRPSVFGKKKKKNSKNFVASVYDFVFGPPRVEAPPLANQKEVAAYLRQKEGIIVKSEIIGLAGWTAPEADDFLTDVLVRYKGDSKISDNRILFGDFYELTRSKSAESDASIVWYWDEFEPEYKLTGNTTGRNIGVAFMNLFNLAFSGAILFGLTSDNQLMAEMGMGTLIFLGMIPFVFSLLFFLVPLLRSFQLGPLKRKRARNNIRKRLMKAIYKNRRTELKLSALAQVVNSGSNEEALTEPVIQDNMNQLVLDFQGELDYDENGQLVYRFYHLNEELAEADRLRTQRDSGSDLGNIIFDSKD